MSHEIHAPAPDTSVLRRRALAAGIAGLAACGAGWAMSPDRFFQSYLVAWLFWTAIALGSLGLLMLQHVTGGGWGLAVRRLLEAAARNIPLMALFFLPVLFGMGSIFEWAHPEAVAADEMLRHKAPYLNPAFFTVRAAIYFAAWTALTFALTRLSDRVDREQGGPALARMSAVSAGGLVLFVLTMTFASVDWVMSLEPHWYSTIYGGLFVAGSALGAHAFAICMLFRFAKSEPLKSLIGRRIYHDLGKLLLAFTLVWSYFGFSQFLIIWAGNLPEEIPWYLTRLQGGWQWYGLALAALQFVAPFLMLLSRDLKRDAGRLAFVAGLVVFMRLVDLHWMAMPAFHPENISLHWLDLAAPIGVGGIWLAAYARNLQGRPILPVGDPHLAEAIEHGHE